MPHIYIAISITVLDAIALLLFRKGRIRAENRLSPLAAIAFGFILLAITFTDNRFTGYGLMGIGVFLAIADIIKKLKRA